MTKKALTLPILISLVVGNMIGTGIYLLPASLAEFGSIAIFAWMFTATGALFVALTFASLNKRYPNTGGPYLYCKAAFGRPAGFTIAYTYWISNLVSIAGISVASIGYLGFITPMLDGNSAQYNPYLALACELGAVWVFTLINIIGLRTAGIVQMFLTVIKIVPLLLVTVVGIGSIHFSNLTQFNIGHESNLSALTSAAALTFWAFIGLESATVPSENTQGPRDIFKATVFGTLIASLVYIASTIVLMGMIPVEQLKHSQFPFAEASTLLFGSHAASIIAICAVISGLGALNVCILVQGQIVFAGARDRFFPHIFSKLNQQNVPVIGHLFCSILISLLLMLTMKPSLLEQFNNIALLAALLVLTTYFVTTVSSIKFLLTDKSPLHKLLLSRSLFISVLAAIYAGWMITSIDLKILLVGTGLILLCIPIYFFFIRRLTLRESVIS